MFAAVGCLWFGLQATLGIADPITLMSRSGTFEVAGEFVGYDGEYIRVNTTSGIVSLDFDVFECDGGNCPDAQTFVPTLRVAGESRIIAKLMPALIDGYARSIGVIVSSQPGGTAHRLSSNDQDLLDVQLDLSNSEDAIASLVNGTIDQALVSRSPTASERNDFADVGLSDPALTDHNITIALQAFVPIVNRENVQRTISLSALKDILAGRPNADNDLADQSLVLHLSDEDTGAIESIKQALNISSFSEDMVWHATYADVSEAVSGDPNALGVVPRFALGRARAISIEGSCGLISAPRAMAIKTQDYPLTFPIRLVAPKVRQHPNIEAFLAWLRSPAAHAVVRRAGLIDPGAVPVSIQSQGDRLIHAIKTIDADVGLPALQDFAAFVDGRARLSPTFRFLNGSDELDSQSRAYVYTIAHNIVDGRYRNRTLMLVGFSDGLGPMDENRALSLQRAVAIKREIQDALGGRFPADVEVQVAGYGELLPTNCDETALEHRLNRRVELWVSQ